MIDDEELFDLYDEVGNDPTSWSGTAIALFDSAEVLRQLHLSQKNHKPISEESALRRMNMRQVFVMLRGMGVECLLKAVFAKRVTKLAIKGNYKKPISGANQHDLVLLESHLNENIETDLTSEERMVLARLSFQIVAGRYPIGTYAKQSVTIPGGGHPFLMRWSDEDEKAFDAIIEKLSKLLRS